MANRFWNLPSFQLEKNVVRLYAQVKFGAVEVDQITFAAKASTNDGDYFVVTDWAGHKWAIALDTTGGAASTPTGANWTAVPSANKAYIDISGATTGSDVSALVHTALLALPGPSSSFGNWINAATSTTHQNLTNRGQGVCAAPVVKNKDDSGAGSITKSVTTAGTNNTLVTANSKGIASLNQNDQGQYTFTFGTSAASLDFYNKLLSIRHTFDATANSGTAPAAPFMYLTQNNVATASKCSVRVQFLASDGSTATNPAANEQVFMSFGLCNSGAY